MFHARMVRTVVSIVLLTRLLTAQAEQAVEIRFGAALGSVSFSCGQVYSGVGSSNSSVTPADYRYFVHGVTLFDESGKRVPLQMEQDGIWQYRDVALLDFEDGSGPCLNGNSALNTSIRGTVPDGRYSGLEFTLGVPFDLNHLDVTTAPSPLNLSAMFWNWQGGHRFLKVDLSTAGQPIRRGGGEDGQRPMRGEAAAGFPIHLGSTGCASDSRTTAPIGVCAHPNRVTVRFDGFDPARNIAVADILAVLPDTNVDINAPETAPGCMSGPTDTDCLEIMGALGLGEGTDPQRLFRMD